MGKIAFVFSGQGAQHPGMGRDLYEASPAARQVFDMAERLRPGTIETCFHGADEELRQTLHAQPCLFATDLACAMALREAGIEAAGAAGFSLGEVAAAAFCGMFTFEEAFLTVLKRAEFMQQCAQMHPGAMSAVVRLAPVEVERLAAEHGVYAVNYNSPQQTVVAGELERLTQFEKSVAEKKGRAIRLNVSGGFHCELMREASQKLAVYLQDRPMKRGKIPLYANATAKPYPDTEGSALLALQVKSPVKWTDTIHTMKQDHFDIFIEVGAGKTLCGLINKIDNTLATYHVGCLLYTSDAADD